MTDNWPYIPRCFYGTVIDNTFRIGPNCPASEAEMDCSEQVVSSIDQANALDFSLTPNPSSTTLQLHGLNPALQAEISQISIYDMNGKIWYSSNGYTEKVDVSQFARGSYFLQISLRNSQVTKKLIVQ